jgi:hypothetical protein
LNQKYLLLGSTTGTPFTTAVFSWISRAISIIIISSFAPTIRITCERRERDLLGW